MSAHYDLPKYGELLNFGYYLFTFAIIIVATCLLTFATGMKISDQKRVDLLTSKSSKSGKNVFIEKISFIWNRLSFRYKSTFRNVFLFKSRFFMTVVSIVGSSVLVLAGMGLFDCAVGYKDAGSIVAIAIVIIAFSAALSALVIYNITNINVSERNREIATLMVLGYHENEVTGYIFREVYIMSFIGAILGLPLGYVFLDFVFELINFGSIEQMNWWTWILAPLVTMIFSFLATLLIRKKIIKINMNESLKSIE
jgi:putative ABC transport system permease protein